MTIFRRTFRNKYYSYTSRLHGSSRAHLEIKSSRARSGKKKIETWAKLQKHLKETFLPYNYDRTMYTRLQNLRQGTRTIDEYAEEFFLLLTRNEINDSDVQLVSRFIGRLRNQIQTAFSQFDPITVAEAHRRAVAFESQFKSPARIGVQEQLEIGSPTQLVLTNNRK